MLCPFVAAAISITIMVVLLSGHSKPCVFVVLLIIYYILPGALQRKEFIDAV